MVRLAGCNRHSKRTDTVRANKKTSSDKCILRCRDSDQEAPNKHKQQKNNKLKDADQTPSSLCGTHELPIPSHCNRSPSHNRCRNESLGPRKLARHSASKLSLHALQGIPLASKKILKKSKLFSATTENTPKRSDCHDEGLHKIQEKPVKRTRKKSSKPKKSLIPKLPTSGDLFDRYLIIKKQQLRINHLTERLEDYLNIHTQDKLSYRKSHFPKKNRKKRPGKLPKQLIDALQTQESDSFHHSQDKPYDFFTKIEGLQNIIRSTKSLLSPEPPFTDTFDLQLGLPVGSPDTERDQSSLIELPEDNFSHSELIEQFKEVLHRKSLDPSGSLAVSEDCDESLESSAVQEEQEYFLLNSEIKIPILDLANVQPSVDSSEEESSVQELSPKPTEHSLSLEYEEVSDMYNSDPSSNSSSTPRRDRQSLNLIENY